MAVTSPRLVTSGYYRNNAYVLLGMNVLAAVVAWRNWRRFMAMVYQQWVLMESSIGLPNGPHF